MRALSFLISLSLALAPIEPTWAAVDTSAELDSLLAHRVLAHLSQAKDFSDYFSGLKIKPRPGDAIWLHDLESKAKVWPKMTARGSRIYVGDGKYLMVIEIKNFAQHRLLINDREWTYDPSRDLQPQLREWAKRQAYQRLGRPHWMEQIAQWILPKASALGMWSVMGVSEILEGNKKTGTAMLAMDVGRDAAGGIAITAGGVAIGAAVILGLVAASYTGLCYLDSGAGEDNHFSGDKFKNCLTAPLSRVGLNWRDNLYAEHISCPTAGENFYKISYRSKTGIEQSDTFGARADGSLKWFHSRLNTSAYHSTETHVHFTDGKIKKVKIENVSLDRHNVQTLDASAGEKLKPFERVSDSFGYFVELCKEPKRVEAVNKALAEGLQIDPEHLQGLEKAGAAK